MFIENIMPLNKMLTETVLNAVFQYRLTMSGATFLQKSQELPTHEVHLKKAIVTFDMDVQRYVIFSSIVEATTGFVFSFLFSKFCLF